MAGTKYPVILTSHMQEAIEGGAWIETAAGLMSFCLELDAKVFSCPLREGERGTWEFETTRYPTSG